MMNPRWLAAALLAPLLVLGALAWMGTRAQVRAAWSSAREEARLAGTTAGRAMSAALREAVVTVPLFPDPPAPGDGEAVDGEDAVALRAVRDDAGAGFSPAGLPRRVLAGFRVFEMTGEEEDRAVLLAVAMGEAASVLTPLALEKAGAAAEVREEWDFGERAREVWRRQAELPEEGRWISDAGRVWWLRREGAALQAIGPEALEEARARVEAVAPRWADLRLSVEGGAAGGEVMESAAVDFPGGVELRIVAARPEGFEAAARQQARWTMGLLGFAVVFSAGGLWLIQRTMEQERRLNAMKSDFVASVSHELRAPVASIRLMADALGAGKIEPAAVREFHELISREGARLSALIENVLDFAGIEEGRRSWDFAEAELSGLVEETVRLMEPLAAERSVRVDFPGLAEPLVARVDGGAVRQALVNLLDNAIKFSPSGGVVGVSLAMAGGEWRLDVADEGPGIDPADHAVIFEKFRRLGSELRRESKGTGIGLSLVKAIAEAHGGRVSLASEPGRGSVFTMRAPMNPQPDSRP